MKASDFRPEHFAKGQGFDRKVFGEYIRASDAMSKTIYTRYLPCVAAGLLISLLFSKGVGGFAGNILALVCIFGGLIAGTAFNIAAAKKVGELASRLGITKEDVSLAREHVKNGTVAWTGEGGTDERFYEETSAEPSEERSAEILPARPVRALAVAGIIAAAWFLLALCFSFTVGKLQFDFRVLFCTAAGVLGAAVCLIIQDGFKWKAAGAGVGLAAYFLYASSYFAMRESYIFAMNRFSILSFFPFRNAGYGGVLRTLGPRIFLALAAAFVLSLLLKKHPAAKAVICTVAAALISVFNSMTVSAYFRFSDGIQRRQMLTGLMFPALAAALSVGLSCAALCLLCGMQCPKIRMKWPGLVWCWLALAGSAAMVAVSVWRCAGERGAVTPGTQLYTHTLVFGLAVLIGYLLLLCGRREGLYMIVLAVGFSLIPQFFDALSLLLFRRTPQNDGWILLAQTLLGSLNPVLAWLSVRFAKNDPVPEKTAVTGPEQSSGISSSPSDAPSAAEIPGGDVPANGPEAQKQKSQ